MNRRRGDIIMFTILSIGFFTVSIACFAGGDASKGAVAIAIAVLTGAMAFALRNGEKSVSVKSSKNTDSTAASTPVEKPAADGSNADYLPDFVVIDGCLEDYRGAAADVVIPYGVTKIGGHVEYGIGAYYDRDTDASEDYKYVGAFNGRTDIRSVTIPDSVTSIGSNAFSGCTGLTSVTIPGSVKSIGDCAFFSCTSLESVVIPDSVDSIGAEAFKLCTSLSSVTMLNRATSVGRDAFFGCTNLPPEKIKSGPVPESVSGEQAADLRVFEEALPPSPPEPSPGQSYSYYHAEVKTEDELYRLMEIPPAAGCDYSYLGIHSRTGEFYIENETEDFGIVGYTKTRCRRLSLEEFRELSGNKYPDLTEENSLDLIPKKSRYREQSWPKPGRKLVSASEAIRTSTYDVASIYAELSQRYGTTTVTLENSDRGCFATYKYSSTDFRGKQMSRQLSKTEMNYVLAPLPKTAPPRGSGNKLEAKDISIFGNDGLTAYCRLPNGDMFYLADSDYAMELFHRIGSAAQNIIVIRQDPYSE